jgi:short-subunit dehydrogenase
MQASSLRTVLITGASAGIGAAYADRFARRGHDVVLVARDQARLDRLATRLRAEYGVAADVLPADLTDAGNLHRVESRLREDAAIGILVNNAGATAAGGLARPDLDALQRLIALNVTSVMRLTGAVVPRFLAEGGGAIIILSSVLAVAPELVAGIYPATKAFDLALAQSLQFELGSRGIYVQAVLPGVTRTEIWDRAGIPSDAFPYTMDAGDLVDAALLGFDRRETVTIPPLPDEERWNRLVTARQAMVRDCRQAEPAARYRSSQSG